jgi:uncharacterized SAM-binding protein YcdF (DUF218 family)
MVSLKTAVRTRRMKVVALRLAAAAAALLLVGFAAFAWQLPSRQIALERDADGIVVLTGGTARIADALELLATGRGKRLLITGVNAGTTIADIVHKNPKYRRQLACCVDLDYSAMNTYGNAVQARLWAIEHGFHSLIVVTSAYHMLRALAELRHQLPDAALTPYPVLSERLRIEPWWSSGDTARLVVSEYLKYLFAVMRMRFDSPPPRSEPNRMSDARGL